MKAMNVMLVAVVVATEMMHAQDLPPELAEPAAKYKAAAEALDKLAAIEPRKAEVVKLRFFVGLRIDECAEVLGISEATAKRDWVYARAWLYREIQSRKQ